MAFNAQDYRQAVLDLYRTMPETPARPNRADQLCADELFRRGVPLAIVEAALLLACARRAGRDPGVPPLAPIRSLRYFLPVIDEITALPTLSPTYIQYCRRTLRSKLKQISPTGS